MNRKKKILGWLNIFIVCLGFARGVSAATCPGGGTCFYVTEIGAGAKDGSSWSNAYAGLPSNGTHSNSNLSYLRAADLTRGATYFVADGTYPGYVFNNEGGGTQFITIKKALSDARCSAIGKTVAECRGTLASDPGWNNSMGDGEAVFNSPGYVWLFKPSTHYYHFDGQVGSGKSPGSFGFRLFSTSSRNGKGVQVTLDTSGTYADTGDTTHITLEHIEFDWNNGTSAGPCSAASSIEVHGSKPNGDWTMSNNYFHHGSGGAMFLRNGRAGHMTIDNNYFYLMGDETAGGACPGAPDHSHWETFWLTNMSDLVLSNNVFEDAYQPGQTGWVMMENVTDAKIYNNVFFCSSPSKCAVGGNGLISAWTGSMNEDVFIYQNTFVDIPNGFFLWEQGTNIAAKNNLFYSSGCGGLPNHTAAACGGSQSCCGTTQQTGIASTIFKDYAADDFRLAQITQSGSNLGAPYNIDKSGNPRTNWSRGAYEFASSADGVAPAAPSSLRITAPVP